MSSITCKLCGKGFGKLSSYRRHVDLKRCKGPRPDGEASESESDISDTSSVTSESERVTCMSCNKTFANKYSLQRHSLSACKSSRLKKLLTNPANIAVLENALELVKSGNQTINNGNLTNNYGNLTNNNNTNHGTINNNNIDKQTINNTLNQTANNTNNLTLHQDIHINPIGRENLDHITKDRKLDILRKGVNAVPELWRAIMENPANWNVGISDKKNKKVMFRNRNGDVEIGDLSKVLNMIASEGIDYVDLFLEELYSELPLKDMTIRRLMECQLFTIPGEEDEDINSPERTRIHEEYHTRIEDKINDILTLHKKKIVSRLHKFIAQIETNELEL